MPPPDRFVQLALLFYTVFAGIGALWCGWQGRPILWTGAPPSWTAGGLHLLLGLAVGAALAGLSQLISPRLPWTEGMERWFREALGPLHWTHAFWLALFSGIGEEVLFRGAAQPSVIEALSFLGSAAAPVGVIVTSALFGAIHWPPSKELVAWPIMAGLIGVLLGGLAVWTGDLFVAIGGHFALNFVNLTLLGRPPPATT